MYIKQLNQPQRIITWQVPAVLSFKHKKHLVLSTQFLLTKDVFAYEYSTFMRPTNTLALLPWRQKAS